MHIWIMRQSEDAAIVEGRYGNCGGRSVQSWREDVESMGEEKKLAFTEGACSKCGWEKQASLFLSPFIRLIFLDEKST